MKVGDKVRVTHAERCFADGLEEGTVVAIKDDTVDVWPTVYGGRAVGDEFNRPLHIHTHHVEDEAVPELEVINA